ncbi:hypothetical protein OEZ85_012347 [Tetradesmus obliquus]|uniref:SBP-type domain-containing protein n=1 Tax=Tetradesmus obliquus TaxID=3088 RepID=A0ABY8TVI5_TETOB|nr:hypothetical protein OEZ85_012347 [Tetradesmus obliquus]
MTLEQQQHSAAAAAVAAAAAAAAASLSAASVPAKAKPAKGGKNGRRGTAKSHLVCKVDDCHTVLSSSKAYYQRHRVCAAHLAAMAATVDGVPSRFCQQCGKFQPLTEFDQDKRSCRSRLKRHNNRRREQRHIKGIEFSLMAAAGGCGSEGGEHGASAAVAAAAAAGVGADEDFSELFDLLLEGTEQQ